MYTLVGFFLLPPIIKWQLERRLPPITKRTVKIRQVLVNPLVFSWTIRGLSLHEPDGSVFASWEEFYVNFQLSSLFRLAWTFKEIHLDRPYGAIILRKDGTFNFANLFPPKPAEPPKPAAAPASIPRVNVFLLSITNGFLELQDQTRHRPFKTEYRPINIRLTDLATRPGAATPYSFRAENDTGKVLTWTGDITAQPFSSHGAIGVRGADPKKYQPFLDDYTLAQVTDGKVNVQMDYYVYADTNGFDLIVSNTTLQVNNFRVEDPATNEVVFAMPSLAIEGANFHLKDQTASIRDFRIKDVALVTRLNEDGSLNLAKLLLPPRAPKTPATNAPAKPSKPWLITLEQFALENASVAFDDLTHHSKFATRLSPIALTAKGITTSTNGEGSMALSVTTEAKETVNVDFNVCLVPPRATGQFKLASLELKKYLPYVEDFVRATIASGQCGVQLGFRAALDGTNLLAGISNGVLRVSDLQIQPPGTNETVVQIPELVVDGAEASLEERSAVVAKVSTSGGTILGRRLSDGTINLLQLLPPGETNSASAQSESSQAQATTAEQSSSPSWSARLDEFDLSQYTVIFEDNVPATPVTTRLKDLTLQVKGITTATNTPVNVKMSTSVNDAGQVALEGAGVVAPPSARLEISVADLDLSPFQAYVQDQVRLGISSALLGVRGTASYTPEGAPHKLSFDGGLGLSKFVTTDLDSSREFVKWDDLQVEGIHLEAEPNSVKVKNITWDGLSANLIILSNKQPNVVSILGPKKTNEEKPQTPPASTPPVAAGDPAGSTSSPASIDTFALKNASFHFTDESIQPVGQFQIQKLEGTVKGLSTEAGAKADMDFKGILGEQSPFSLAGTISALTPAPSFTLTFSNRNLQLPFLTPYTEKFAGHPLNRGRLSMVLQYDVQQSKVSSQNKFQVDQLMLGPRNESPDATKLPVKLGIALLKDSEGKIVLDVPVEGTLGDPQFRVRKVIGKTVMDMITKAATSPFKLLGSLVGGGEELAFIDFVPGTTTFVEGETNKIGKLSKALAQRTSLGLEVEALVDPRLDREAVARGLIREDMRAARARELTEGGQASPNAETDDLDPSTYARLLRSAVTQQFGTNLNQALEEFTAIAATNAPPTAQQGGARAKKPGFFARLFTHRGKPVAQDRRHSKADAKLLKENPRLAGLDSVSMEGLLASRKEVPEEKLRELMEARAKVVQTAFVNGGLDPERLFLVPPKPVQNISGGQARVNLSLN